MRITSSFFTLALCVLLTGCGQEKSSLTLKPAPSGGAMIRLPKDRGFVAVKTEAPDGTRVVPTARNAKPKPVSIVAYFYQADGSTAMNPAPTEVVFELGTSESAKSVALLPDASDPNRFASQPGLYSNALQGTVRAKINGEDVRESFSAL